MELWIRSQDREDLVKMSDVIEISARTGVYTIITMTQGKIVGLGNYQTKERAIEVLDEIQNILIPKLRTVFTKEGLNVELVDKNYDVYEMPEE